MRQSQKAPPILCQPGDTIYIVDTQNELCIYSDKVAYVQVFVDSWQGTPLSDPFFYSLEDAQKFIDEYKRVYTSK